MDAGGLPLYLLLAACFLLSGYFSAAEAAYSFLNKVKLKSLAEEGSHRAERVLRLTENSEKIFTTVLIGGNLSHIGCASITALLVISRWGESKLAAAILITSAALFLLAETLPRGYAKAFPERVALAWSGSLNLLTTLLTPVTCLFYGLNRLAEKLMGRDGQPTVTEEEFMDILETIEEEGNIESDTTDLVQSALEFGETTAQDVLTPRVDVVAVEKSMSAGEILDVIREEKYSRIPVYEGSIDNIVGVLHVRPYLQAYITDPELKLDGFLDPIRFVPKSARIDELFEKMSEKRIHMVAVADDYGGLLGIITIEDILEALVGDIWDEDDDVVEEMVQKGPDCWEMLGTVQVSDAFEEMDLPAEPEELEHSSMGGWAMEQFPSVPKVGDSFTSGRLTLTVTQMENNRITRLQVQKKPADE